jgi:hypothetical protein
MEPVDGEVEGGDREIEREVFGGKMILGKLVWVFWFSTHAGFRFFKFFFLLIKVSADVTPCHISINGRLMEN